MVSLLIISFQQFELKHLQRLRGLSKMFVEFDIKDELDNAESISYNKRLASYSSKTNRREPHHGQRRRQF